ncbi:hypothetical protein [Streptomyces sp. NPDC050145]|uniref:hypothetical protein n=1 Tax=Streptomyces sp. NPDC050145 TaxID=3365602 RepID=UPI00378EBF9C
MSPNQPKTPPRQIRIGNEWYDFELAVKAQDSERASVVRAFIDWYIRRPGAELPERPDAAYWRRTEADKDGA